MAVMAYSFDLTDTFCLFAGDDSLVLSRDVIPVVGATQMMANTFNLECKFLRFSVPYFCSKFLIQKPNGKWIVVPDVVKLVTKLGRTDLANGAHVEKYRISVADNIQNLRNQYNYPYIDHAIRDRYRPHARVSFDQLYSSICTLADDPQQFARLYYEGVNDRIDHNKVFRSLAEF